MKTFNSYRMLITPLSPVHVGTGESYEPTNYVIEEGVLHEFDTGAAMAALTDADRKSLLEIGNRRPDWAMILAARKFFFDRRESLMPWAVQRIPVTDYVGILYKERIARAAQIEASGAKVLNELTIDRTSFNPATRLPILFGSSLKGAIRTALLDGVNAGKPVRYLDEKKRKENNLELQTRLFQYRPGKFELDPMRLVQLSDAAWCGESGLPAAQVHLAVNRKKVAVLDEHGNLRKSKVESGNGPDQILECVPGWRYRAFFGQLNLQLVTGVPEQDRKGNRQLPTATLRFDAAQIANACNAFYRPILEEECSLLHQRGYLDTTWYKAIQAFLATSQARMQRGDAFLLRVGRHSGAESVTLNGVRNIKIMKGKDEKPEYLDAAKTLWLAADEKDQSTRLLPFGWLLVELHPMEIPVADWPKLQAACEPHLVTARAFKERLAAQQVRLEQARAEAEVRRRQEEEQSCLAAESEARRQREEEERLARLAALTPNQRRVEEFITAFTVRVGQLRGGKDRQNTDYHQRAQSLAKNALEGADWTADEKRAAADAIAEWLPKVVERIDKDQLKKLKLGTLRSGT